VTDAAAAAPGHAARWRLAAGWGIALRHAALALGVLLLLAEAAAIAVRTLGGGGSLVTTLRVGGLYVAAFHRVPIRLSGRDLDVSSLTAGRATTGSIELALAFAPLAVTAVGAWLLWRGGRAVAEGVGGGPLARALHGAKVAPPYAAGVLLVCLLSSIGGPFPFGSLVSGRLELSAAPVWGFALPLALAGAAGVSSGWWSAGHAGRLRAAVSGGVWMLSLGLVLSYTGLLIAGSVRPEGVEALLTPSTARYHRAVFGSPATGTAVVAHHLAVAPNEAAFALVPAMGGCLGVYATRQGAERFLCYWRYPRQVALPAVLGGAPTQGRFGPAPMPYLLFLLVPATAALLGGRRAALRLGSVSGREAALAGGLAGVVFGAVLVPLTWLASISASGAVRLEGLLDASGAVRVGPGLVGAGLLGLAWGIAGGTAGAWLTARKGRSSRPTGRAGPQRR
jgi:hypothetical protein